MRLKSSCCLSAILMLLAADSAVAQRQQVGFTSVSDADHVLSVRERTRYMDEIVEWRLQHLLPGLMDKHGIDLWLVIDRENNKDPVAKTIGDRMFLGRFTALYRGAEGVERRRSGFGRIKALVAELDPAKIGINTSALWNNGDGLTGALEKQLREALGEYSDHLVSAEDLSNEWLETKTDRELSVYRHVAGVTHDIISEAFSNQVIVPDVTTVQDVAWYIEQRIADLGLIGWAFSVAIQRSDADIEKYGDPAHLFSFEEPSSWVDTETIIRRGDILHSDIGTEYLGLNTDNQHHVYILRKGETDVPEGLKQALRNSNRLQDIFMSEFVEGRSGNDITFATLERARAEGLTPMVYTHPIGYHQHSGGTIMGADGEYAQHNPLPKAEYPLHYNTVWAIELETISRIPEWDGKEVEIAMEEQGAFTEADGAYFVDGRQTSWFVVH